jgi:hypothetical protein
LFLLGLSGDEVLDAATYGQLKSKALNAVRGTVQADILKEDQAQNTCIFSTEFSLRLMGDMQAYFIDENIRNFYSVSISGYHIAEAGANRARSPRAGSRGPRSTPSRASRCPPRARCARWTRSASSSHRTT